jgi:3-phenylpropionate/cinnamic acid dioxygenase small subunit
MSAQQQHAAPDLGIIEEFLYREADCLDRADLDAWFELYTPDATYWMPVTPDQQSPETEISIFYDDRLLMEIRRRNFGDEWAASMDYDVRCSHIIGNIRFSPDGGPTDGWRVLSNFQAAIYYRGKTRFYAGRYTHDLVQTGDGLQIKRKRVDLINSDSAELGSIVIYL